MRSLLSCLFTGGMIFLCSGLLEASDQPIREMDLEKLMSLDVQATSVMKRVESVFDTPASVYVLTGEKIRLSGARNAG